MWRLTPLGGPGLAFSYLNKWGCCKSFGWGVGSLSHCTVLQLFFLSLYEPKEDYRSFFFRLVLMMFKWKTDSSQRFPPLCSVRLTFSWDDDTVADCFFFCVSSWFVKRRNQTACVPYKKNQQHHHAVQDPCMDHQLQERQWWSWCILYYNYVVRKEIDGSYYIIQPCLAARSYFHTICFTFNNAKERAFNMRTNQHKAYCKV